MDDYREIFKRELDRLNYLYSKANTKSKKKRIAHDLIFFENMYNSLSDDEKVIFPWSNDEILMDVCYEVINNIIRNVLDNQRFLIALVENSFEIFLESEFSVYCDYMKKYHKIDEALLQKYIVDFFNTLDDSLKPTFIDKFNSSEILVNNTIENYAGLFFPFESISKNVIFITSGNNVSIEEGRILVHEMGHNFEFENATKNGVTNIWNKLDRTIFSEVSSSFFEYAYINYLIENNLYKEDAMMLKRKYLDQIYGFLCDLLIIFSHSNLKVDPNLNITLESKEIVNYANELLELMNSSDGLYEINDKLNFRKSFVYGISKLLGIYIYDSYKNNPKDFLANFKTILLEYKDIGIKAFYRLGITEDTLIEGNVLKKTLKECK